MLMTVLLSILIVVGVVALLIWLLRTDDPDDADHVSQSWLRAAIRERREG